MGFFDSLFGTSGKSSSTTNQTQNTVQNQTQTQSGDTTQTGNATTSTLDPETIAMLQGVIGNLAGGATGANVDANTIRALSSRLANTLSPDIVNANIASSQAEAKRQFGIGEGAQIAGVEQQIGSKGNAFSQLLEQKGNIDLTTALADIENKTRLAASSQESANISGAISGETAAVNADAAPLDKFLAAIKTLTGAQTTQNTSQQQLSDILTSLAGTSSTTAAGTSTGKQSQTLGLFPTLASLGL